MPDARASKLMRIIEEVATRGQFILRQQCAELEGQLSTAYGSAHTVVTSSPEAALLLVLNAIDAEATTVDVANDLPAYVAAIVERAGGRVEATAATVFIRSHGRDAIEVVSGRGDVRIVVRDLGPDS